MPPFRRTNWRSTRTIARQIVKASPLIVAIGKRVFYAQIDMDQHAAYEHTGELVG